MVVVGRAQAPPPLEPPPTAEIPPYTPSRPLPKTTPCPPPPPPPLSECLFFLVSFCPCLPGPLGLDKLPPTSPPCPLTA